MNAGPGHATWEEERALRERMEAGEPPHCPRCGTPLLTLSSPPRSDVAYVRYRVRLECPSCAFRATVDRK